MSFSVDVSSPYVEEVDNGIRSFEVEADSLEEARDLARQCMCESKEVLIKIESV